MAEYIVDTTEGIYNARTTGELVRCRDCVHFRKRPELGCCYCARFSVWTGPRNFCSWAEKRDDGTRD